jgi:hypothetical protein
MADAAQTETIPQVRAPAQQSSAKTDRLSKVRRFGAWLVAPDSRAVVYLGLAIVVLGFAVIAFTWSKVAATLSVALQLPYIASGGLIGLGLVVLGVGVLTIGVKRRENFGRVRQIEKLSATMESIQLVVDGSSKDDDSD